MTTDQIQQFMDMLTGGELPDGMEMPNQPQLSPEAAFSVIWYLQEHLRIIPDRYEMCDVCHEIFDVNSGGYIISDDSPENEWYREMGIEPAEVKAAEGKRFCSESCERDFWRNEKYPNESEEQ